MSVSSASRLSVARDYTAPPPRAHRCALVEPVARGVAAGTGEPITAAGAA